MKRVSIVAITIALVINPELANAATKSIKIKTYASASISTSFTLPAKDECKEISFKYSVSSYFGWPYSFTSFQLTNKAGEAIGRTIVQQGDQYDDEGNEAPVPFSGKSSISVCRYEWDTLDEDGNGDTYIAVKKGTYYFSFNLTQIRPFQMDSSKTIAVTFK